MERMFDFVRYLVLGAVSGIISALVDKPLTKGLMFFVFIASVFLILITILYPEDVEIRQTRINQYLGR